MTVCDIHEEDTQRQQNIALNTVWVSQGSKRKVCVQPNPLIHGDLRSLRWEDNIRKMDRPGVRQIPEGSGEQGKMEKTGCKIICGALTTLAVKGLMMMTEFELISR